MTDHKKFIRPTDQFQLDEMNLPISSTRDLKGVGGDRSLEKKLTNFYNFQSETVFSNPDEGAHIVLGRDRPGAAMSETTGLPRTDSIDIVVGRLALISDVISKEAQKNVGEQKKEAETKKWSLPDFDNDAARIYISHFTNIDRNFNLPLGKIGNSFEESGIGLKADSIRVISRTGGIKLVSMNSIKNATGLRKSKKLGVNLISGIPYDKSYPEINKRNNLRQFRHDMQAIPKTDNLVMALDYLIESTNKITGMLLNFAETQLQFNEYLVNHTHIETFEGNQGIPSKDLYGAYLQANLTFWEETLKQVRDYKSKDIPIFKKRFLRSSSDLYIGSRFHFLN